MDDDKKCENCKYWIEPHQPSCIPLGLKKCGRAELFWDCTQWDERGENREFTEEAKGEKAFVQDGSDYYAELLTLRGFSCNQFDYRDEISPDD